MKHIIVELLDNLTHEVIESVPMDVTEVLKIVVETSDIENTKITVITKPQND